MQDPLSRTVLARVAGTFFAFSGAIACLMALLRDLPALSIQLLVASGALALAVGLLAWRCPWERWPRNAILVFVPAALVIKTLANVARGADPYVYVVHYLILFMWVGLALPRGAAFACAPALALSYLFPLWWLGWPAGGMPSALLAIPACVFVGEAAGWLAARMRRAEQESAQRAARMSELVDATFALATCQKPDELAQIAAAAARDLFAGARARVLLARSGEILQLAADVGWPCADEPSLRQDAGAALLLESIREPRHGLRDPAWQARLAAALDVPGVEALPMRGSSDGIGILLVAFDVPEPPLDRFTIHVGRLLATQAALGLERIWLAEQLREDSLRDPLTQLGNRRKLAGALELLKEGDALAVIDLDHFKRVNDTYGHAAGDRLLRSLADFARDSLRPPDEVFRIGGEEFLIVLAGAGPRAGAVLERISTRWRAQSRVTTFSAGIAVHGQGRTPEETLSRADEALYAAKRAGRDRVVVACDEPAAGPSAAE